MTILRPNDYVLLSDGTHAVIESIDGENVTGYDEEGERMFKLRDIVHLDCNLDDEP